MNRNPIPTKQVNELGEALQKRGIAVILEHSDGHKHVDIAILEYVLEASYVSKDRKMVLLEKASVKLNIFRFFVRLMKESKTLDIKKYTLLQGIIDEIGRMLGGWIRSTER